MKWARWLLPMASLAIVLWLTWRDAQGGRTAPGPLHPAHAAVASLAQGAECAACHRPGAGIDADGCVRCHAAIGAQRVAGTGLHGRLPAAQLAQCDGCHGEHHGDAVALIAPHAFARAGVADPTRYDHAHVAFGLRGAHARLPCSTCHAHADDATPPAGGRFLGLRQDCVACHADAHRGAYGGDCASCHGQEQPWAAAATFHHAAFALADAHAGKACAACHAAGGAGDLTRPRGAAVRACRDCHADPHGGSGGPATGLRLAATADCARCHAATNWSAARPDVAAHAARGFALAGAHATAACAACHGDGASAPRWTGVAPAEAACASCHVQHPHRAAVLAAARAVAGPADGCADCHLAADPRWSDGRMTAAHHVATGMPLTAPHADVACAKCHTAPTWAERYPGRSAGDCRSCHRDVHGGQFADEAKYAQCTACHATEHWAPHRFGIAAHAATAWPLTGAHEAVACSRCHAQAAGAPRTFHGTPTACAKCHRDVHGGAFDGGGRPAVVDGRRDCARCHDTTAFAPATAPFDHARWTNYALVGAHAAVACAGCHPPAADGSRQLGPAVGRSCAGCHADPHAGQVADAAGAATDCARCHEVATWRPTTFDHQTMSRFPLDATHAKVPCGACHRPVDATPGAVVRYKPLGTQCADCHRLGRDGQVRR
jgi:hypothetical protein